MGDRRGPSGAWPGPPLPDPPLPPVLVRGRWLLLARLLTEVVTPVVLAALMLVLVGALSDPEAWRGAAKGLLAAGFVAGIPQALLLREVRSGRVTSGHNVRSRRERPRLMLVSLVSVVVGLGVVALVGAPRDLFVLVVAMVTGLAVATAISTVWQVSLHLAGAAGAVAVLVVVVGPWALLGVVVVVALAWARVVLGDHTIAQVIGGTVVGAGVAGSVMALL